MIPLLRFSSFSLLLSALMILTGCQGPPSEERGMLAETVSIESPGVEEPQKETASLDSLGDDFFNEDLEESGDVGPSISDPFKPINRFTFAFNDKVYNYLLSPISKAYTAILPKPAEQGVINFFDNITFPKRFVGNLMQGKIDGAVEETGRFLLDSTLGVGGLMKPSKKLGMPEHHEDFGQTLGKWGIGNGPYIVLPFLGPSTLRDTVGRVGDGYLNPFQYADEDTVRVGARALDIVADAPVRLDQYNGLKQSAIDPYEASKDAYVNFRRRAVAD